MVRAEFELPLSEGSWEDIELGGDFTCVEAEAKPVLESRPTFDPNAEARKIEDWIAFNLDEKAQGKADRQTLAGDFLRDLDRLAAFKKARSTDAPTNSQPSKKQANTPNLWPRFQVARKGTVTVVRLTDRTLLKADQLEALAADLLDLIDAGNPRIVVNFAGVERISSLIAAYLAEADRRCRASEGGALRVCLIQPQLTGVFAIPGLTRMIPTYPDEASAFESPWPSRSSPAPLPVEILSFLASNMSNTEFNQHNLNLASGLSTIITPPMEGPTRVWLIELTDTDNLRPIGVNRSRFIIGREQDCHLRLKSAHVSKAHASIELRGGLYFLKDLGSTNGTMLNGRRIQRRDVEIRPGDRIAIGNHRFVVASGPLEHQSLVKTSKGGSVEDLIVGWVHDEEAESPSYNGEGPTLQDLAVRGESGEPRPFKYEVIEDVLVVTPRIHRLSDEEAVASLRSQLQDLFNEPLPRRVVVSLEFVSHLSPQAIGALLAHQLRLERAGGALRLCLAGYKLMAVLERIHLPMLTECHATLEDAILVAWP